MKLRFTVAMKTLLARVSPRPRCDAGPQDRRQGQRVDRQLLMPGFLSCAGPHLDLSAPKKSEDSRWWVQFERIVAVGWA